MFSNCRTVPVQHFRLLSCTVEAQPRPTDGNYGVVERPIDGDTLLMGNGQPVRLIQYATIRHFIAADAMITPSTE